MLQGSETLCEEQSSESLVQAIKRKLGPQSRLVFSAASEADLNREGPSEAQSVAEQLLLDLSSWKVLPAPLWPPAACPAAACIASPSRKFPLMCHSLQALIFRDSRCLGSLVSPRLASYTDTEGSTLAAEERDQDSSPKLIVQELSIIYDTWTPAWSSSQAKPIYLPVDASFRSSGFRIGDKLGWPSCVQCYPACPALLAGTSGCCYTDQHC